MLARTELQKKQTTNLALHDYNKANVPRKISCLTTQKSISRNEVLKHEIHNTIPV